MENFFIKGRQHKELAIKDDHNIFSHLFISCQNRECDLKEFFRHENPSSPPALTGNGIMHQGTKSQLMSVLEDQIVCEATDTEPEAGAMIIDGSAFVHALPPTKLTSFDSYVCEDLFR